MLPLQDTAGQEALKNLRIFSYPDTSIFLIGYDMTKKISLENVVGEIDLADLSSIDFDDDDDDENEVQHRH